MYGEFINAVISFLLIAAVVYFLVVRPYTPIECLLGISAPTSQALIQGRIRPPGSDAMDCCRRATERHRRIERTWPWAHTFVLVWQRLTAYLPSPESRTSRHDNGPCLRDGRSPIV
jgi:hypothetical protein